MAQALEIWSLERIEEALGGDAGGVLPDGLRLADIHVRLPRHQVAMLEHFAERDRTTVSGALARELDGVASGMRTSCRRRLPASPMRWRGRIPKARNSHADPNRFHATLDRIHVSRDGMNAIRRRMNLAWRHSECDARSHSLVGGATACSSGARRTLQVV